MDISIEICNSKKAELDLLRPLSPEIEQRVLQKLRLDWNYHSNHLEGNSLSYGETKALILHGLTAQGKPLKDHFEITGHNDAVLWVEDLVRRKEPLTEAVIRQLHVLVLKEDHEVEAQTAEGQKTRLLVQVGAYKTLPNHVRTETSEIVYFATPLDTPQEMQELLHWYKTYEGDPIFLASLFHYRLIRIHPFADGNGRVARLAMNFILMMHGFPPVIVKTEEKSAYLSALRTADAGETKTFAEYVANNLITSLDIMLRATRGESIEDPSDIGKELALLKQRFEQPGNLLKELRSKRTMIETWDLWLGPWLCKFLDRQREAFLPFYLKHYFYMSIDGAQLQGSNDERQATVKANISSVTRSVEAAAVFSTLRRMGHADFGWRGDLVVRFDETLLTIFVGEESVLSIGYGVVPTEKQLAVPVNMLTRQHMGVIEQWIEANP